jgi:hypothetical protein
MSYQSKIIIKHILEGFVDLIDFERIYPDKAGSSMVKT